MDRPVTNVDALHFGGRRIAERLDTYLAKVTRDESALVVGLSGPWGSGKSSIVETLRQQRVAGAKDVELLRLTDMPHPATLLFKIGKALTYSQRGNSFFPSSLYHLALGSSRGPTLSVFLVFYGVVLALHFTMLSAFMGENWEGLSTFGVAIMALIATVIATSVQTSNSDAFGMFIDIVHALSKNPPKSSQVIILDEFDRLDEAHMRLVLRAISVIASRLRGVCIVLCYDKEQVKGVLYPARHSSKSDSADGNKDSSKNRSQIQSNSFGDDFAKYINVEFTVPIYSRADQAIELVRNPLMELSAQLKLQVNKGEDVKFLAPGYYYPRHFVRARILAGSVLASMPKAELPISMGDLITASLLRVVCPDAARVISELYFESGAKRDFYTIQVERERRRAVLARVRDGSQSDPAIREAIGGLFRGGLGAPSDKEDAYRWELTWEDWAHGVIYGLYLLETLDEAPELRRLVLAASLVSLLDSRGTRTLRENGNVSSKLLDFIAEFPGDVVFINLIHTKLPQSTPVDRHIARELYLFVQLAAVKFPELHESLGNLAWSILENQQGTTPDDISDFRDYLESLTEPLLLYEAHRRIDANLATQQIGPTNLAALKSLKVTVGKRMAALYLPSATINQLKEASQPREALLVVWTIMALNSLALRQRILRQRWKDCPSEPDLVYHAIAAETSNHHRRQVLRDLHELIGMNTIERYAAASSPGSAGGFRQLVLETMEDYRSRGVIWKPR